MNDWNGGGSLFVKYFGSTLGCCWINKEEGGELGQCWRELCCRGAACWAWPQEPTRGSGPRTEPAGPFWSVPIRLVLILRFGPHVMGQSYPD